jgi:hypothetical protein
VFDVSLAGAPDGTIHATSGIWQHVNEWNEQSVVVSQLRLEDGETAFTRSVKVRDLAPAPMTLPGEAWRTSMQASIGVDSSGTVYELTGDYVSGKLHMYLAKSTDDGASFPTQLQLTSGTHDEVMPWMSVTPDGRVDAIFYDYDESTGLMDVDYGQVAAGGTTMSRTVLQTGIDGDSQPPRGPGGNPFMGDYLGIDSTGGSRRPRVDRQRPALAGRLGRDGNALIITRPGDARVPGRPQWRHGVARGRVPPLR